MANTRYTSSDDPISSASLAGLDQATKSAFELFAETFSNWRTLASLGCEPVLRMVALGASSPLLSCLSQGDCPSQMHVDAAATLALLSGVEVARQDILQLQGLQRLVSVLKNQALPALALVHVLTAVINLSPCDGVLSNLCDLQAVHICLHLLSYPHPGVVAQASFVLRIISDDSHNCYAVFLTGTKLLRAVLDVVARSADEEALCNAAYLASALYRELPLFVKTPSKGVVVDQQLIATYDECIQIQRGLADACMAQVATSRCLPVVSFCMLALFEISKNYESAIYMHSQGVVDAVLTWSSLRIAELPADIAARSKSSDANTPQQLHICVHVAAKLLASLSSVSNVILIEISTKETAIAKARGGK
jgi:hypothetical protein